MNTFSPKGLFLREARVYAVVNLALGLAAAIFGCSAAVFGHGIYVKLGLGLPGLGVGLLWLGTGARVLRTPWRHESFEIFPGVGAARLLHAATVEAQIEEPETTVFGKGSIGVFLTREWFVSTVSGVEAFPLQDLLWCYPESTKYSVNFVPLGTVSRFVLYPKTGPNALRPVRVPVLLGAIATLSLMEELATKAPQAFFGYRPEWAQFWPAARPKVIEHVERRRQQLASKPWPTEPH